MSCNRGCVHTTRSMAKLSDDRRAHAASAAAHLAPAVSTTEAVSPGRYDSNVGTVLRYRALERLTVILTALGIGYMLGWGLLHRPPHGSAAITTSATWTRVGPRTIAGPQ